MRPSPQTILLRNSTGKLERYVSTPARPPWETEKHHIEARRDRTFAALPFPPSQPPIYGSKIYPGRFDTSDSRNPFTWTYVEAQLPGHGGLARHFLRRSPDGYLHLKDELLGQTYRVIGHNIDDTYPAEPNFLPEKPQTRTLISVHCETYYGENDYPIHRYFVAEKLPDGKPKVPYGFTENWHALRKLDGSWCFRPKTESTVPEAWQPHLQQRHKLVIDVQAETRIAQSGKPQDSSISPGVQPPPAVLNDAQAEQDQETSFWDWFPFWKSRNSSSQASSAATWQATETPLIEKIKETATGNTEAQKTGAPSPVLSYQPKACPELSAEGELASVLKQPDPNQNYGNQACTEMRRSGNSNYPITKSPQPTHPITQSVGLGPLSKPSAAAPGIASSCLALPRADCS
ncbi:MAG TPA: hypothetical protein VHA33_19855 [Candidatus Angelobacter sp.]|jgi:hypothetical protein|nr:hypothetical protein [Candidatus Angelobacter sp.]